MKISVVTTLYYSSRYVQEFYTRTLAEIAKVGSDYEFIFVNDGSPDDALDKVLELMAADANITIVDLSRNFGHNKAIMTGLQHVTGDYIFLIDCDLEESPELFSEFWTKLTTDKSLDVVFGVQKRRKGGWFERTSGRIFYLLISWLTSIEYPANSLTARIMTRRYVDAVGRHHERELEIWGIFVLAGFKQSAIPVQKGSKGSTTYTFRKKLAVAIDTVTSLSNRPLYFIFVVGVISFVVAGINVAIILYEKFFLDAIIEGWASTLASIWLVGGMILLVLGILGIYLSKMFSEIKARPLSVIKKIYRKGHVE